jgi:hypothetical protein
MRRARPHYSESYFLSVMLASNDDRMKAVAIKLGQNTQTPFPPRNSKSKAEYDARPVVSLHSTTTSLAFSRSLTTSLLDSRQGTEETVRRRARCYLHVRV